MQDKESKDSADAFYFIDVQTIGSEGIEAGKIYLTDTSGLIRNSYTLSDEDIKKLVAHTAILLPMPKKKEIKLRRKFNEN